MDITITELKQKLDRKEDISLIDVREPYEHEEFNIGGRLIPLGEIPLQVDHLGDEFEKEIIIYCRSGNRSAMACYILEQAGYKNVKNLTGGILAWQDSL